MLVGPGGIGKTAIARELLRDRPGVFVDLARPAARRSWWLRSVGRSRPRVGRWPRPVWWSSTTSSSSGPAAAGPIAAWAASGGRLLLTTRVQIALQRAHPVPVGPLDAADAVALLARRATGSLLPDDPALVPLVEALERNPLCIELAAPRLRLLAPTELLRRLEDRFVVLRTRDPGRAPRHLALEVSLDASWQLLDDPGQRALLYPSAFRARFRSTPRRRCWGKGA